MITFPSPDNPIYKNWPIEDIAYYILTTSTNGGDGEIYFVFKDEYFQIVFSFRSDDLGVNIYCSSIKMTFYEIQMINIHTKSKEEKVYMLEKHISEACNLLMMHEIHE